MQGKVVWITGGGTGIGRAAALMFAGEGARVALLGRRVDPLNDVLWDVRQADAEGRSEALDVANRAQVAEVAARLLADWKRVDILVNNAGLNVAKRRLRELSGEDWDQVITANLTGAFNMIQAVLPPMRAQQDGLILNVSSLAAKQASGLAGTAYVASKHGMNGLSLSVNTDEWMHGIRSTALCPGEVNTPILDKRPVQIPKADRERLIHPEDMAQVMRCLALLPARTYVPEMLLLPVNRRALQPGEVG